MSVHRGEIMPRTKLKNAIKKVKLGPKALIVANKYMSVTAMQWVWIALLIALFIIAWYWGMNLIEYGIQ